MYFDCFLQLDPLAWLQRTEEKTRTFLTSYHVAEGILPAVEGRNPAARTCCHYSCVWIDSALSPPGWKPRLYGRQNACRHGSGVQRANMDFGEFSPRTARWSAGLRHGLAWDRSQYQAVPEAGAPVQGRKARQQVGEF